jgi:hypothetical protein
MGFGTCQHQIVRPWSKLAQGWRPIMEMLRLLQQRPEEFVVIRHAILPPSISFMQLPRLHSVSWQPGPISCMSISMINTHLKIFCDACTAIWWRRNIEV